MQETKPECDHLLGMSKTALIGPDGNQRFEIWDDVNAKHTGWGEDGIIQLFWTGPHYKYCPKCGAALGNMRVGLRDFEGLRPNF